MKKKLSINIVLRYLEKPWLGLQFHDTEKTSIKKPEELENEMEDPPAETADEKILDRIMGSMMGMTLGDALGAHVEFRPHQYLVENPVGDLEGGGTWGLQKGQVILLYNVRDLTKTNGMIFFESSFLSHLKFSKITSNMKCRKWDY